MKTCIHCQDLNNNSANFCQSCGIGFNETDIKCDQQPASNINQVKATIISTVLSNKTLAALETMMMLQAEILAHLQNASKDEVIDKYKHLYNRNQIINALNVDLLAEDKVRLEEVNSDLPEDGNSPPLNEVFSDYSTDIIIEESNIAVNKTH